MPKGSNQKLKLYYLSRIFVEKTDENHMLNMAEIKEELLMDEEGLQKTQNKLIFIGRQIEIDGNKFIGQLAHLRDAARQNDVDLAVKTLREIVPTFTTPEEFNSKILPRN